jgi:hypothetical protein
MEQTLYWDEKRSRIRVLQKDMRTLFGELRLPTRDTLPAFAYLLKLTDLRVVRRFESGSSTMHTVMMEFDPRGTFALRF